MIYEIIKIYIIIIIILAVKVQHSLVLKLLNILMAFSGMVWIHVTERFIKEKPWEEIDLFFTSDL